MANRVPYSANETQFLLGNYTKMSYLAIATALGRSERSVNKKLYDLRHKRTIPHKKPYYESNVQDTKLMVQGQRNSMNMKAIMELVHRGELIDLLIEDKREKCVVEYKNDSYFSVKRKNYVECFGYSEILQGLVTILV